MELWTEGTEQELRPHQPALQIRDVQKACAGAWKRDRKAGVGS